MLINKVETMRRTAAELLSDSCAEEEPVSYSVQERNWFPLCWQREDKQKKKKSYLMLM